MEGGRDGRREGRRVKAFSCIPHRGIKKRVGGDYHKDLFSGGKNFNVKKVRVVSQPPTLEGTPNECQSSCFQLTGYGIIKWPWKHNVMFNSTCLTGSLQINKYDILH